MAPPHLIPTGTLRVGLIQALGLMKISDDHLQRIKDRQLMAFGSWVLVVAFGILSLAAKRFGHEFLGSILLGAAILFGVLFVCYVLALMLTVILLIARRTKDQR
jgi:uncharacterized membrane protein YhaH (DUF805 family)